VLPSGADDDDVAVVLEIEITRAGDDLERLIPGDVLQAEGDRPGDFAGDHDVHVTHVGEEPEDVCELGALEIDVDRRGEGHIFVKFTAAGVAAEAVVDKGPWLKTPVAKCIATEFKKVKVPAFTGEDVKVGKSFRFE
jgi:hypothetical protein